ncbi:hypothetical protein BANRA_04094 [Escherichia coli]|nr:hypothetical protein BANRA_04094 [Escherichia coli]
MLRFHIVFLVKYSCNFTNNNKIILNKNKGNQFRHRHNNTANSYILLIAIVIAPLIAPFVTGYVNANYHPCGNNTGFSEQSILKMA